MAGGLMDIEKNRIYLYLQNKINLCKYFDVLQFYFSKH